MLNLKLTVKDNQLRRLESELRHLPDKAAALLAHGTNITMDHLERTVIDAITDTYTVDKELVEASISKRIATKANPTAQLRSYGPALRLRAFDHFPVRASKKTKPAIGVHVKIRKDSAGRPLRGTFIAQMKSGHIGVFARKDNARRRKAANKWGITSLGIKEPTGPAVPSMVSEVIKERQLEAKAAKLLEKNIDKIIDSLLW
ncbi:MAG: hypothetical protein ABFD49_11830 [Armatimonadota bacterium]|nr:hypothetical protein [bacterium]